MSRRRSHEVETRKATSAPDITALSTTVRRGATVSAVTLVIVQVVSFAQTLVLARLLSTEEIGLFAAGTVLSQRKGGTKINVDHEITLPTDI